MEDWNLKPPFIKYISAPRGSGKTFLLINMLIHPEIYAGVFDKIYLFCPSVNSDPKYQVLYQYGLNPNRVFLKFNEKKLEKIIKNKKKEEQILIIFDDCISDKEFKISESIMRISFNGRHIGVSAIITAQKTTGGSTAIRSQADGVIIFRARSQKEIDTLYEDNSIDMMDRKGFRKLIDDTTREQYSFLYINYQNNKIFHSFKELNNKIVN